MSGSMTSGQRSWWRVALELKMRRSYGDAFQDLFSVVMGRVHGDDFVRTRPFGVLGDKGCDGYLQSSGQVFQCYGAINGSSWKAATLIEKMGTDYAKAAEKIPALMKQWHMTHNLVDGLPTEAVETLAAMRKANPQHHFGFLSLEGIEAKIFSMTHDKIEDLLGRVATSEDSQNLEVTELRALVANVARAADAIAVDVTTIAPVPVQSIYSSQILVGVHRHAASR